MRRFLSPRLAAGALATLALLAAGAAQAERAWVRGEVRLNLRAGPEPRYRIIDVVKTGDEVEVLERGEEWVKLRDPKGNEGWIRSGYLQPEAPASVQVTRLASELSTLRERVVSAQQELASLRNAQQELDASRGELEKLRLKNRELRAGQRWPEWVAGASLLAAGMLIGTALHRSPTRRAGRIRI